MKNRRDPSLHIKASDLSKVLKNILPIGVDAQEFTKAVLKASKSYAVNTRSISITTERVEKKANKILASSTKDADLMARAIYAVRISLKHKGIVQIKPTARDWGLVKEIANFATNFALDFNLNKRQAYINYIRIAAKKMKSFNISRIPSMNESISKTYEAELEINVDPNPDLTRYIHDYYRIKVGKKTGMLNKYTDDPERYVYFVRVAKVCKELGLKGEFYIDAQFAALDYRESYPEPPQLIGQKAKERLNKWLYEKNIKV